MYSISEFVYYCPVLGQQYIDVLYFCPDRAVVHAFASTCVQEPEYSQNSYHYHSSRVSGIDPYAPAAGHLPATNTAPPPSRVPPFGGNNDDDDSNGGVDSGQGSSLDRDYASYNGHHHRYSNGGPPPQANNGRQQAANGGQFYYNLPTTGRGDDGGGISPRRRAPGDTLDLSNREYRGSAFELYKKPGGFQPFPSYGEVQR
jgi:hypothetical protein